MSLGPDFVFSSELCPQWCLTDPASGVSTAIGPFGNEKLLSQQMMSRQCQRHLASIRAGQGLPPGSGKRRDFATK